jgi:hypothetical protein
MRLELLDDPAGEVRGNGEADADVATALTEDGAVDADDLPAGVEERPTGVAGIDRGIGLYEAEERLTTISSAPSTTWWLVTMVPCESMMNPEPRLRCLKLFGVSGVKRRKNSSKGSFSPKGLGPCGGPNPWKPRFLTVCVVEMLTTAGLAAAAIGASVGNATWLPTAGDGGAEDSGAAAVSLGGVPDGWEDPQGGNQSRALDRLPAVNAPADKSIIVATRRTVLVTLLFISVTHSQRAARRRAPS